MVKSGKRPMRNLPMDEKLHAIRRVSRGGESKASVARDIGIPESTLRGWCKNEEKLEEQLLKQQLGIEDEPTKKRPRTSRGASASPTTVSLASISSTNLAAINANNLLNSSASMLSSSNLLSSNLANLNPATGALALQMSSLEMAMPSGSHSVSSMSPNSSSSYSGTSDNSSPRTPSPSRSQNRNHLPNRGINLISQSSSNQSYNLTSQANSLQNINYNLVSHKSQGLNMSSDVHDLSEQPQNSSEQREHGTSQSQNSPGQNSEGPHSSDQTSGGQTSVGQTSAGQNFSMQPNDPTNQVYETSDHIFSDADCNANKERTISKEGLEIKKEMQDIPDDDTNNQNSADYDSKCVETFPKDFGSKTFQRDSLNENLENQINKKFINDEILFNQTRNMTNNYVQSLSEQGYDLSKLAQNLFNQAHTLTKQNKHFPKQKGQHLGRDYQSYAKHSSKIDQKSSGGSPRLCESTSKYPFLSQNLLMPHHMSANNMSANNISANHVSANHMSSNLGMSSSQNNIPEDGEDATLDLTLHNSGYENSGNPSGPLNLSPNMGDNETLSKSTSSSTLAGANLASNLDSTGLSTAQRLAIITEQLKLNNPQLYLQTLSAAAATTPAMKEMLQRYNNLLVLHNQYNKNCLNKTSSGGNNKPANSGTSGNGSSAKQSVANEMNTNNIFQSTGISSSLANNGTSISTSTIAGNNTNGFPSFAGYSDGSIPISNIGPQSTLNKAPGSLLTPISLDTSGSRRGHKNSIPSTDSVEDIFKWLRTQPPDVSLNTLTQNAMNYGFANPFAAQLGSQLSNSVLGAAALNNLGSASLNTATLNTAALNSTALHSGLNSSVLTSTSLASSLNTAALTTSTLNSAALATAALSASQLGYLSSGQIGSASQINTSANPQLNPASLAAAAQLSTQLSNAAQLTTAQLNGVAQMSAHIAAMAPNFQSLLAPVNASYLASANTTNNSILNLSNRGFDQTLSSTGLLATAAANILAAGTSAGVYGNASAAKSRSSPVGNVNSTSFNQMASQATSNASVPTSPVADMPSSSNATISVPLASPKTIPRDSPKSPCSTSSINASAPSSGTSSTGPNIPSPTTAQVAPFPSLHNHNDFAGKWFWKWYNEGAPDSERPILYQQLTKDSNNTENSGCEETKPAIQRNGARAVLDNLLLNNNVDSSTEEPAKDPQTQSEALSHGEKFLEWLENCSEPSVTALQILQFKSMLNSIKNRSDRKTDCQRVNRRK